MHSLPVLRSRNLVLRPVKDNDSDALQRHWNRRAVRQHLWDGMPVLSSHVAEVVEQHHIDVATRGIGLFTIRHHDHPDRIIGCAGLRTLAGPTADSPRRTDLPPALTVSLDYSRRRQGLARQAVELVLDHARIHHSAIQAIVATDNIAAEQGLRSIGFVALPAIVVLGAPMPAWRLDLS